MRNVAAAIGGLGLASLENGSYVFAGLLAVSLALAPTARALVPDPVGMCGDGATLIHDIQGSGAVSPLVGEIREIEGIVVGDFQGPAALNGFFVQEEDGDVDADPATSEGIFVFDPLNAIDVAVGDLVRVRGVVAEVANQTQINLETVIVCSSGNVLPTSEAADLSVTKTDGVTSAVPGGNVVYTIVVENLGPNDDPLVKLTDTLPADLSCTYMSVGVGASGNTPNGAGDLDETLNMFVGGSVTYTVTCAIDAGATGTISNTATVTPSRIDLIAENNSATDDDTALISPARQGCGAP